MTQDLQLRIRISADGRAAIEGTQQVERQIDHLGDTAKKIGGLIAGYLSFQFLSSAVQQLFAAGAALQDFQTRFNSLAGSTQAAAAEMAYVQQAAQKLALDLNTARDSYAQLLAQQQAGVITQQQARDLLEGFGRAAQMTGAGAEQVKQAMAGLSQALSSGTVSTEDFRQAVDPLPGMMKQFADAMGVSIGQLKENLEKGKVSSADFAQAMIKGLQAAGKGAQDFSQSLSAVWQRVKNEWTLLLEAFGAADFLSALENSSFNEMAASLLDTLEQTLKDATALIQSGWLSDAFAAQLDYLKAYWDDFKATLADAQFFSDVDANWGSLWEGIVDGAGDLLGNLRTVFTDFPEIIAAFTVMAASQIDQWVAQARVSWAMLKAGFSIAWEEMKQYLVGVLNSMIVAVAQAVNSMGQSLGGFLSGAAQQLRNLPDFMMMGGVADAFQAGADRIQTVSAELVQAAEQRRAAAEAESKGIIAGEIAKVDAVQAAANAQIAASEQAAQQTVLELNARTQARDAAIEHAQGQRRAAEAAAASTPITSANSAALAANAAESDKAAKASEKAAKAKKDAADKIAEQSQKLGQETAALQRLTAAYLTFNDATVAQVQIENDLEKLDPALRDQGRAKALAELNAQTAKRLYDLDHEAQLTAQEALATLQGTAALDAFNLKKELESVLRERNTGALDAETAQVVEQKIAAEQLAKATDAVMDAYQDSLTPLEKYKKEMERIAQLEATLKGTAGAWTEQAQRGIEELKVQAQETLNEADPLAQAFKSAAEGIYNAWSGMWETLFTQGISGFGDVVDQIKTMFLKMLAQLAASALAKPILLPIVQSMGGLFGMNDAGMAPIVNNLFGSGTMSGAGGVSGGLGMMSNLSTGFGLFGGGGIGSGIGGMISGAGGLFGSIGMQAGGAMMSNLGLFSGIASSFSAGLSSIASSAISTGIGLMAAAALPVIGAIGAIASLLGDFGPTPHPSSIATVGGFWNSENGPEYPGKGGGKTGASGLIYGYDWGHTDPAEAAKIRDAFMEIDQALVDLVPNVDLAGQKLGEFGQTAEGFIANGEYVDSMDEVTAGFVQAWVNAAAETGAVSELVNQAFQSMTGTAEELLTAFSALQQMDAAGTLNQQMIDIALALKTGSDQLTAVLTALGTIQGYGLADPIKDFEILLKDSLKTTFARLGDAGKALADDLADVNLADASRIQELAGLVQARYALELQALQEITAYLNEMAANFSSSIEEIQLSVMDTAQQYAFYSEKAAAAFDALQTATDPADIARLAEEARQAAMSAYGLLDDAQKQQVSSEFVGFLEDTQKVAQDQLNAAQQQIVEQHQQTAELLAEALQAAGEAAADALEQAATELEDAGNTAANAITSAAAVIRDAMRAGETVSVQRMATGGFVGGAWNGQAGTAGDTVATMLTPGEAVISREQAQKHAGLLRAIMADQVRYAASGVLPGYGGGSSSGSGVIADLNTEIQAAFTARQQSDLKMLRTVFGRPDDVFDSPDAEEFILGLRHFNAEMDMLNRVSETEKNREQKALRAQNADALADFLAGIRDQLAALTKPSFEQTLAGIARQFEQNMAQAQALGANEEELATIRELANRTLDQAIEQRNQEMDALIRTANSPAIPDAVEQLQALMSELAAAEAQAQQLGATEQELALIRAGNESRLREFEEDRQAQLDDILRAARESGLSEFTKSLMALDREMAEAIRQARELGATEQDLAALRAYAVEQTRAAAQSEIDQRKAEAQQEIDRIASALDALIARFAGVKDRIEEARVNLMRERADWDEVVYQNQRLGELQQRLAGESAEDQINTLGEIQDAILARYDAEKQANSDLMASAEKLQDTARRIRDYLNSLKLSSLTPLSPDQRLTEARTQWQTTLTAAQSGDTEALGQLTDQANAYLSEAQNYFASSPDYAAIFAQVTAALESVAGRMEAGPTPEELTAENTAQIAKQQEDALAALEALRQQAEQLQGVAQSAAWKQTRAIQDELQKQTQNILSEMVAQQANDTENLKLTAAEFQELRQLLSKLSENQLNELSQQMGAAKTAIGATEALLTRILADGGTQQAELERLLNTQITVTGSGATQTVEAILSGIKSGTADAESIAALLNQSLSDGQVQTGNLSLLLSKHLDVAGLSKEQIVAKLSELILSGEISTTDITNTLRWMTTTGTLPDETLQSLLDGFRQGAEANQLMVDLLRQRVDQGGADAALAQSMLDKLSVAQTAYADIVSLLDQIRNGDLSFTADVASRLQQDLSALNTNNELTTQMQNVLNGAIIEDKNQTVAHIANLRDQFTVGTPRTQLDWISGNTSGTWKAVQEMSGVLWGMANGLGGYATGGYAEPGLAVVGEEGPELVRFTQPGVVYTAAQTRELLSGANARPIPAAPVADNDSSEDTEAVVMELKALIRLQASANQQLIKKLDAVESRLAGIESKARLEAAA